MSFIPLILYRLFNKGIIITVIKVTNVLRNFPLSAQYEMQVICYTRQLNDNNILGKRVKQLICLTYYLWLSQIFFLKIEQINNKKVIFLVEALLG